MSSLELWIEKVLSVSSLESKAKGILPSLAHFGVDRNSLNKVGIGTAAQDRLYRALYVYSKGFHDIVEQVTRTSNADVKKVSGRLWSCYIKLLEFCEPQHTDSVTKEVVKDQENVIVNITNVHEQSVADAKFLNDQMESHLKYAELESISLRHQLQVQAVSHTSIEESLRLECQAHSMSQKRMESTRQKLDKDVANLKAQLETMTKHHDSLEHEVHVLTDSLAKETDQHFVQTERANRLHSKVQAYDGQKSSDRAVIDELRHQLATQLIDRQSLYRSTVELDKLLCASNDENARLSQELCDMRLQKERKDSLLMNVRNSFRHLASAYLHVVDKVDSIEASLSVTGGETLQNEFVMENVDKKATQDDASLTGFNAWLGKVNQEPLLDLTIVTEELTNSQCERYCHIGGTIFRHAAHVSDQSVMSNILEHVAKLQECHKNLPIARDEISTLNQSIASSKLLVQTWSAALCVEKHKSETTKVAQDSVVEKLTSKLLLLTEEFQEIQEKYCVSQQRLVVVMREKEALENQSGIIMDLSNQINVLNAEKGQMSQEISRQMGVDDHCTNLTAKLRQTDDEIQLKNEYISELHSIAHCLSLLLERSDKFITCLDFYLGYEMRDAEQTKTLIHHEEVVAVSNASNDTCGHNTVATTVKAVQHERYAQHFVDRTIAHLSAEGAQAQTHSSTSEVLFDSVFAIKKGIVGDEEEEGSAVVVPQPDSAHHSSTVLHTELAAARMFKHFKTRKLQFGNYTPTFDKCKRLCVLNRSLEEYITNSLFNESKINTLNNDKLSLIHELEAMRKFLRKERLFQRERYALKLEEGIREQAVSLQAQLQDETSLLLEQQKVEMRRAFDAEKREMIRKRKALEARQREAAGSDMFDDSSDNLAPKKGLLDFNMSSDDSPDVVVMPVKQMDVEIKKPVVSAVESTPLTVNTVLSVPRMVSKSSTVPSTPVINKPTVEVSSTADNFPRTDEPLTTITVDDPIVLVDQVSLVTPTVDPSTGSHDSTASEQNVLQKDVQHGELKDVLSIDVDGEIPESVNDANAPPRADAVDEAADASIESIVENSVHISSGFLPVILGKSSSNASSVALKQSDSSYCAKQEAELVLAPPKNPHMEGNQFNQCSGSAYFDAPATTGLFENMYEVVVAAVETCRDDPLATASTSVCPAPPARTPMEVKRKQRQHFLHTRRRVVASGSSEVSINSTETATATATAEDE